MSDWQVFGDWRDLRGALERADPDWSGKTNDERAAAWDAAKAVIEQYHPMRAKCLNCGDVVPALSIYRCADCHTHYCERCIRPHFGPNHRSHP